MIDCWKICYTATYPDGKMLMIEREKPFMTANIVADTEENAVKKLMQEFRGLKVKVVEPPQHSVMSEHEYDQTKTLNIF